MQRRAFLMAAGVLPSLPFKTDGNWQSNSDPAVETETSNHEKAHAWLVKRTAALGRNNCKLNKVLNSDVSDDAKLLFAWFCSGSHDFEESEVTYYLFVTKEEAIDYFGGLGFAHMVAFEELCEAKFVELKRSRLVDACEFGLKEYASYCVCFKFL